MPLLIILVLLSRSIDLIDPVSERVRRRLDNHRDDQGVQSAAPRISEDPLCGDGPTLKIRLEDADSEIFAGSKVSFARIRRVLAVIERAMYRCRY